MPRMPVSHGRVSSDNHRKSFTPELVQSFTEKAMVVCRQTITAKRFTPELVQSFTAKAMVVCGQTITAKVSHQNWCKVSKQKPWSYVVRQSPQKFHTRAGAKFHRKSHGRVSSDNHRKKFHTRTGAKFHSKSHGRMWSDNHRKSLTPELVQSFKAKAMVVCGQTITAKVSHQSWCKVSQKKPWSCVVRQSPQKVSHQSWCKVSQQKPWSYVVRQSPQKSRTRTGAKFHRKSNGRVSSDNHRKSFTPELVQSFTAKAMVVCGHTITANVSHQNWCKVSQQKPWSYVLRQSLSWSALVVCHSEQMLATNLFSEESTLRACPLADKLRIFLQLTKRKPKFVSCQFLFVSLHPN